MTRVTDLPYRHLTTLILDVDFANVTAIGATPAGRRGIAPVTGGRFEGAALSGTVRPGADWFLVRPDATMAIDVRLTLDTADGATLYLSYTGAMIASPETMAAFRNGAQLAPDAYRTRMTARLESGDARYAWLNHALVVGIGAQLPAGVRYDLFEIAP